MKLLFAVIGLASCAFAADAGPVASACGPDAVRFAVKTDLPAQAATTAEPGKALVYVVEDSGPGRATVRIGLDGAWVGANRGDSWFSFPAEPGEHHLCADWQLSGTYISTWQRTAAQRAKAISLASFTAKAGEVYYFRVSNIVGWREGWYFSALELVDRDEGQFLIASYPFSTFRPKK